MLRLDQLVAAIARSRLWLTDAYYSGISSYVQALSAAVKDGVDVRLLVPHATDLPLLEPFSRAGYGTLLEAGIRVFEWNGTMLHATGAVLTNRRVLGPVQARLTTLVGLFLCALAVLVAIFPRALAFPAAAVGFWGGLALLWRGIQLRRSLKQSNAHEEKIDGRELVQSRDAEH